MNRLATLLIACLLIVVAAGCGDDETSNPVVCDDTTPTMVVGNIILRPYVDFSGSIYPTFPNENPVDSVKFGDSLCSIYDGSNYVPGNDFHFSIIYDNMADSTRFDSGDTVEVEFFVGDETVSAFAKLISNVSDTTVYIVPDTGMYVIANQPFDITWHPVENADWYSLRLYFATDSTPYTNIATHYESCADTVFTVPAEYHVKEGSYNVYVGAVSGPVPGTQEVNVDGANLIGAVYSSCVESAGVHVIVVEVTVTGIAKPVSAPGEQLSSKEALWILSRH